MSERLLLLELNEVNLDVAKFYVDRSGLRNIARMFQIGVMRTTSEQQYALLEPWIQWVSAHTGTTASEHGITRLGDIVGQQIPQIFERVEQAGFRVGAVSPMNVANNLSAPSYFLPDPWTRTPTDGSFWSRHLWSALSQAVNDNSSGRITPKSLLILLAALFRFAKPRHWSTYLSLALRSRRAPWRKAMFLDLLVHDVHMGLFRKHRPDFSTLFLNAGAHIQHHYFCNSPAVPGARLKNPDWYVSADVDPLRELLELYDLIVGEYMALSDTDLVIATGLTQQPYDRVKFYYRLRDHGAFLRTLGLTFKRVLPRMTRDFLIEFESDVDCLQAQQLLESVVMEADGQKIFGEMENRGHSLFVTLTYPHEIVADATCSWSRGTANIGRLVAFVAVKNGMHSAHGYQCFTGRAAQFAPPDGSHVSALYGAVSRYFGIGD